MKTERVKIVTWRNAVGWCWSLQDAFGTSILRSRITCPNERRAKQAARENVKFLPKAYRLRNTP